MLSYTKFTFLLVKFPFLSNFKSSKTLIGNGILYKKRECGIMIYPPLNNSLVLKDHCLHLNVHWSSVEDWCNAVALSLSRCASNSCNVENPMGSVQLTIQCLLQSRLACVSCNTDQQTSMHALDSQVDQDYHESIYDWSPHWGNRVW